VYRHFLSSLRQAADESLSSASAVPRLAKVRDRLVLEPFAAFGVTEVPNRGEIETIGSARVVHTWFQTPLLTRRFAAGQVHLSCTVNWHPLFDRQLRSL